MASAAAILVLQAGGARAQTRSGAKPAAEPASVAEVIVTAQRREERLVDVPISVSAFNARQIKEAGVTTSQDLGLVTPGLRMDGSGAVVQPAIRGVTTLLSAFDDANIAIYIDGVFQPTLVGAVFDLRDVSSVEVLKGPQGTLFGRNATGGAILIHTLQPDLERMQGSIAAGYSSWDTISGSGFISMPLVAGKVALSVSAAGTRVGEGYVNDLVSHEKIGAYHSVLLRGKLRFLPWDGADFTITGLHSVNTDPTPYLRTNYHGDNRYGGFAAAAGQPLADEPWEYSGNASHTKTKNSSVSLAGDIAMGPGKLTTRTAYLYNTSASLLDGDNTPLVLVTLFTDVHVKNFSQELTYATDQIGRFRAIGGVFYYNKNVNNTTIVNNYAVANWLHDKVEAYAAFGELTYDITDKLSITGGGRYSHETFTGYVAQTSGVTVRPPLPFFAKKSWDSFDPRVSLGYKLNPAANLYFTYSRGFKSGLFNVAAFQAAPVDPERISAFEAGFKGRVSDALFLTAAGFYYDYKDLQSLVISVVNALPVQNYQNAASVRVHGLELGATWRATDAFTLDVGGQYLDAKYHRFPAAAVTTPLTKTNIVVTAVDASGNRMVRAPKLSGTMTGRYSLDTHAGRFTLSGTLFATSKVFHDPANRVQDKGYVKLNADAEWSPATMPGLTLRVWGKNLTNSKNIQATLLSTSYDAVTYAPPWSVGVEASYKFD
jgi:iron complex outermembrane receptor protein